MAVAQPDILLVFNEASGTAVTNYGSLSGGGYAIQGPGSSPTDYAWSPQALSPTGGLLDVKNPGNNSANMPYLTTAATAPSSAKHDCSVAVGFVLDARDSGLSRSYILTGPAAGQRPPFVLWARAPTGGGDFDLLLDAKTSGGFGFSGEVVATALTHGTLYKFSAAFYYSGGNVSCRYKLGASAVVTLGPTSDGADTTYPAWPVLLGGFMEAFSTYGGIDGQLYYYAFERAGTAWTDTDLGDINSNPAASITGWPAEKDSYSRLAIITRSRP